MIACTSGLFDAFLVILGGVLAGAIGIYTTGHTRKRDAISHMIADIGMIMTVPKDMHLHATGESILRNAIWRARPYISEEEFRACLSILAEYQQIDRYELAEQKEASFIWSRANGDKTIEDRLREFVDRLAIAVKK